MNLYRQLDNKKLREMDTELSEYLWDEFYARNINDQDDFYTLLHEWIDNQVIYNSDCEAILEGNSEYHYDEHDIWGRPDNIMQAAYACLYDYIMESPDTVTFADMEEVLNEK